MPTARSLVFNAATEQNTQAQSVVTGTCFSSGTTMCQVTVTVFKLQENYGYWVNVFLFLQGKPGAALVI